MILPLLLDTAHCSLTCYSLTTTTGPSHSTQIRYNKPLLQDTVHYPHCVHGYIHNITPLLRIKDTSQYTRHTMGPSIGSCFGGIYLSMLLLWALKQVMSSYTELIGTQPLVVSNNLTIVCIVLHVILKLFVWDFSHIVNNWLAAVRTPSLSNHYRTNETNISMDISKCFSLWKEQAKNARGGIKSDLSVNNDAFQYSVRTKTFLRSTD